MKLELKLTAVLFCVWLSGAYIPPSRHASAASGAHAAVSTSRVQHFSPAVADDASVSRRRFAAGLLGSALLPAAVLADDRAGTKDDPAYKACLSKCLYFCTKDKIESKDRATCLKDECKPKCARTDAQRMLGVPAK